MTQQFDEGVKEILMTLLSLGATAYETDYIINQLNKRPEPIEQKIQALNKAEQIAKTPKQIETIQDVKQTLKQEEPVKQQISKPTSKPNIQQQQKPSKEQYIFNKLTKGGLTPIAAVGIIANLKAESELNPSIKQYGGGPGRGLVQWEKGGRFDTDRINLVSFAKKQGKPWTDLDAQIDFILYELNKHPEYIRVKQALNQADNIEKATLLFLRKYEKAGTPHTQKRLKYAKELYSRLASSIASN